MSANEQQSPPPAATAQPQAQVPSTTPNPTAGSENLACQWQGCGERCSSAEQLYDHVCERHVGRKSTNNLNLTCQWGTCRTTTVKRDHITSHIRVHVPLKPHKCEFCGKAFKRPQDLKKHVKTHADDSVILRSPEPTGGARPAATNHVYNVSNGKTPSYYETTVTGGAYNHANPQYYQPQHQQQQHSNYGSVYYATMGPGADIGNQASYEARKRGYEALDQFFADLKRRNFDPASYAAVGQRLLQLQGLQLPDVIVPAYQPAPALVAVGGHGGHHPGPIPPAPYVLPPMPNLRTKSDLTSIDQFLEQMQSTVYENDTQVAAAGIGQPGAHYVPSGIHYRSSHSPPSVQLPSSHQTATAPIVGATSSRSPHSGTPALTPPSSAQSYTSGHSPVSVPSHHFSPGQQSSSGMYPTLPATTAHENMEPTYTTAAAPTSTLGSLFDNDPRRRYSGGMLQRAAPGSSTEVMDSAMSDSSATPPAKSPTVRKASKPEIASSLIDPALGGNNGSSPAAHSDSMHGDEKNAAAEKAEEQWVENIRVIEALRQYVRERLEKREYIGDDGVGVDPEEEDQDRMEGVEHEAKSEDAKRDDAPLYPVLRGLDA